MVSLANLIMVHSAGLELRTVVCEKDVWPCGVVVFMVLLEETQRSCWEIQDVRQKV